METLEWFWGQHIRIVFQRIIKLIYTKAKLGMFGENYLSRYPSFWELCIKSRNTLYYYLTIGLLGQLNSNILCEDSKVIGLTVQLYRLVWVSTVLSFDRFYCTLERSVQVAHWLVQPTRSQGPRFESSCRRKSTHDCMALHCTEPFFHYHPTIISIWVLWLK